MALDMVVLCAKPDEGAIAHPWQLLMAGQLPVLGFFSMKWLPRAPRQTLYVLAVQAGQYSPQWPQSICSICKTVEIVEFAASLTTTSDCKCLLTTVTSELLVID